MKTQKLEGEMIRIYLILARQINIITNDFRPWHWAHGRLEANILKIGSKRYPNLWFVSLSP